MPKPELNIVVCVDRRRCMHVQSNGRNGPELLAALKSAVEELREETGLCDVELGPWVWNRQSVFEWRNRLYQASERFYLVRVEEHTVSSDCLDPVEAVEMTEHWWWPAGDILASTGRETFAPRRLGELLPPLIAGEIPPAPIETGT